MNKLIKIGLLCAAAGGGLYFYLKKNKRKENEEKSKTDEKKTELVSQAKNLKVVNLDDKINEAIEQALSEDTNFWKEIGSQDVITQALDLAQYSGQVSLPMSIYWTDSDAWADYDGGLDLFNAWFGYDIEEKKDSYSIMFDAINFMKNLLYYRDTMHNKPLLNATNVNLAAADNALSNWNNGNLEIYSAEASKKIDFIQQSMLLLDDNDILNIRVMLEAYITYCYVVKELPSLSLSTSLVINRNEVEWFKFYKKYGDAFYAEFTADPAVNLKLIAKLVKMYKDESNG